MTADPATFGVAVIDVSDPTVPKAVRVLRDRGALYSTEAMAEASTPERKVLVAGTYENGGGFVGIHGAGGDPNYIWDWYVDALLGARFIGHPFDP